ncbi:MAG: CUAEP/CCAEP-tail radical SAM protein [Acidobacteriota bacterium]|nr:CUAEP/CCAEP-tail radical SAM protein [Acidobacteriota bacterium]
MNVLLISTYELGRQPFGLASPTAWLREAGHTVTQLDLSRQRLNDAEAAGAVRDAQLICFYLPMHAATRLALPVIARVRALNPAAGLCAFGLYAPLNAELLRDAGVATIIGGEFESQLLKLAQAVGGNGARSVSPPDASPPDIFLDRLRFRVPDRAGLPALAEYARLRMPDGSLRTVGYTEASRGCKHLCRHCPVVNVYNGKFFIVQREIVLEDIRRQVVHGAQHITFGDPDFFNGPTHALEIVRALHREFPGVTYDATIKIEHLLQHAGLVPELRATGCAFVVSAVESLDDAVLARLEKHHTRAGFLRAVALMRSAGLPLSPTFIPFTPWTTLASYCEMLATLAELDLVEHIAPVQLAIRLLIPAASRLLELEEVRALVGEFDRAKLAYPWQHLDPRVDELQREVEAVVALGSTHLGSTHLGSTHEDAEHDVQRGAVFAAVRELVQDPALKEAPAWQVAPLPARATIPYLTEPWYC